MKNNGIKFTLVFVTGLLLLSAFKATIAVAEEKEPRRPNIVLLVADQLRYQSLGYAGDDKAKTPRLDRLAREAMSFRNYVVSTPVCSATRATFFTGKYASSTGMVINELRLNPNQDCLGHVLTAGGYDTSYIGKWHLWANQLGGHGLVKNAYTPPGPYRLGFDGYWAAYNFNHQNYHAWYFRDTPKPHRIEGFGPDKFTDMAIQRLEHHSKSDRPFFLTVQFSTPHDPWGPRNVPKEWYDKFADTEFTLPPTWKETPDELMDRNTDPKRWLSHWKPNLPGMMRGYYAMTANLDWNVGRILDALGKLGLEDDTIVIFSSDHGDQFGAHGRVFKMIFYEESSRVPMLVRWPKKIAAGSTNDACMASPDLMPTILGFAGLPVPGQVEGMDLSHLALGQDGPEPEFALLQGMGHTCAWRDGHEWRALRDKRYTYARYLKGNQELLFDNIADPSQSKDLAGDPEYKEKLAELRGKLNAKMAAIGDDFKPCSWYRQQWTDNRVILRGGRGPFRRETGPNVPVDVNYQVEIK